MVELLTKSEGKTKPFTTRGEARTLPLQREKSHVALYEGREDNDYPF